jgi:WD40 repeat protein
MRPAKRIFLSVAGPDVAWGEWADERLRAAGLAVEFYKRSFPVGTDFVGQIDSALAFSDCMVALLSPGYCDSRSWVTEEWHAALAIARRRPGFLIPLLIEPCSLPPLLNTLNYVDLTGLAAGAAEARLLHAVLGDATFGAPVVTGAARFPGNPLGPVEVAPSSITIANIPDLVHGSSIEQSPARYAESIRTAIGESVRPDLLILSGVARSGRKVEYEQAAQLLKPLLEQLQLQPQRVVISPGRGDVNTAACRTYFAACAEEDTTPARPYWRKWRYFAQFFEDFYNGIGDMEFSVGKEWMMFSIPELRVAVAAMNSTLAMSHLRRHDHGQLGKTQLQWFARELADEKYNGWLRLASGYHDFAAAKQFFALGAADVDGLVNLVDPAVDFYVSAYAPPGDAESPLDRQTGMIRQPRRPMIGLYPRSLTRIDGLPVKCQVITVRHRQVSVSGRTYDPTAQAWQAGRDQDRVMPIGWPSGDESSPESTTRAASELKGGPRQSDFAERVLEIARLKHGADRVKKIDGTARTPTYLRVTVEDGPVIVQYPVGLAEQGIDRRTLSDFVSWVHRQYTAIDAQLTSELVYAGEPADRELVRAAQQSGVRLQSFVEYQGLLDLRAYSRGQSALLSADPQYPHELYLPQRYRFLDAGQQSTGADLLGQLMDWLTSDQARFILVLGDFGRGKTFLLRQLARAIPQTLPHLTPILIDLRRMEKTHTVDELLAAHLVTSGEQRIDIKALRYMLRSGRIVLLFDGFDELALRVTYQTAADHLERLLQAVDGQAKIVVTSRTQHFLSHGQVRSALGSRVELLSASRLVEVDDFSAEQIDEFLRRLYAGDAQRAAARLELIRDIRDLLGLSRNPRMLGFIASLDEGRLRAAKARTGSVSSADLYSALVRRWLLYEEDRSQREAASATMSGAERWDAVTALALRLWHANEPVITLSELTTITGHALSSLVERGIEDAEGAHIVGSGSLLARTPEGEFSFIHASVMEFLVAAAAAHSIAAGTPRPEILATRVMSALMVDFFCGSAGRAAAADWAASVLHDADATPAARRNALAVAQLTAPAAAREARLAGAVLDGADLSELDLSGADLRNANLTGTRLARTKLTGASLRGAQLTGSRLEQALLTGADLRNADLTNATLVDCGLERVPVAGSVWEHTAVLGGRWDAELADSREFAAAAVAGRDSVLPRVVEAGSSEGVVLAPDGRRVAIVYEDELLVFDTANGEMTSRFPTYPSRNRTATFSPGGDLIAVGGRDHTIRVWDVRTKMLAGTFPCEAGAIWAIAFSADENLLAAASGDRTLRIWRIDSGGAPIRVIRCPKTVYQLNFSPVGDLIASSGGVWNIASGEQESRFCHDTQAQLLSVCFSADGRLIASSFSDGMIKVQHVGDNRQDTATAHEATNEAWSMSFSPDGNYLATAGGGASIRLWNIWSESEPRALDAHGSAVYRIEFGAEGSILAGWSSDGALQAWTIPQGIYLGKSTPVPGLTDYYTNGFFSAAAQAFIYPVGEGGIARVQLADFSVSGVESPQSRSRLITPLANPRWSGPAARRLHPAYLSFQPHGEILACGCSDGTVQFWNARTASHVASSVQHKKWINSIAFSPDGTLLASASDDDTGYVWRSDATPVGPLAGHDARLLSVAFSPDSSLIATASDDRSVRIWSAETLREVRRFANHPKGIDSVSFSPDGRLVASGGQDHVVRLWNVETGELQSELTGHHDRIWSVAFSPDMSSLASGSADGLVRLWNVSTGELIGSLAGHADRIWVVSYDAQGRWLYSASDDGTVRRWDAATGDGSVFFTAQDSVGGLAVAADGSMLAACSESRADLIDLKNGQPLATMIGSSDSWITLLPDGRYKWGGKPTDKVRWLLVDRSFGLGELDSYVADIRRIPDDVPLVAP